MPTRAPASEKQLSLKVYKDFTAGLWQRGTTKEVPPNGLTVLTDALPLKSGGLRAAMRWTTQADNISAGLDFRLPKPAVMAGFTIFHKEQDTNHVHVYVCYQPLDTNLAGGFQEIWASPNTGPGLATAFTRLKQHQVNPGQGSGFYFPIRFLPWAGTIAGATQSFSVYWHVAELCKSTEFGIWQAKAGSTGVQASSALGSIPIHFIEGHQQSIVVLSRFASRKCEIDYTDVGADSNAFSTGNPNFLIMPERLADVTYMASSYANDLYVLRKSHGWVNVQGPLNSPTVYEVTRVHAPQVLTYACATPKGYVYMTSDEGIFAFNGSFVPEYLSPQFVGTPMALAVLPSLDSSFLGQPVFGGHYLFTPKGYILDFDTGAWFITSQINTGSPYPFFAYDDVTGLVWAARTDSNGYTQILTTSINESTMARASSYTFEVPSVSTPAHLTELRLIEFDIQNYAASTISVLLTYNDASGNVVQSTLGPFSIPGTGDQQVRIDVGVGTGAPTADYFKIRPTISTAAPTEAPTLGEMRVWTKPGPPLPFRR